MDANFKFDENGRKISTRVENTVGKGEIASYEQFLLFPQSFQKTYRRRKKIMDCLGKVNLNGFEICCLRNNPIPLITMMDLCILNTFADNKFDVAKMIISICDSTNNVKRRNTVYQHVLLISKSFQNTSSTGSKKVALCGKS